jgi:polyisoprenyl-phosphate glycosyltransferase
MRLSVLIPVYNEAETLPLLLDALRPVLGSIGCEYEILFVDDGSLDGSARILAEEASDPRVKVLTLSRNFGHQAAITAGLDFVTGDAVVVMDADLQDPPAMIPDMVALYRQGFDVVSAQRVARDGESPFKRGSIALFYALMGRAVDERLRPQVGDFRLFSRAAVTALRGLREQHRFIRGLVTWLGLKEAILPYRRPIRAAGKSKYPAWKLARLAWTAITSFSALPLRLTLAAGLTLTAFGLLYSAFLIYQALVSRASVGGWSSLACLQILFSGATLTAVGLVGDYVARIYEELKGRPLYVVSDARNLDPIESPPPRAFVIQGRGPDA